MTSKAFDNATDANRQQGGRRNLIINGAMQVAQRGDQTGVTNGFACDRFNVVEQSATGVVDVNQSTDSPDGFSNSMQVDVTTAQASMGAADLLYARYKIEGQDVQQLKYGTASAQSVTLSFWVKSSVTGTYNSSLFHNDATRINKQTYTVNTADTWEHKTLTFSGDTSNGFDNDNNVSLSVHWVLAAGSNYTGGSLATDTWGAYTASEFGDGQVANVLNNTANNFYITGVQLEVGPLATPFEHRSYGEELALCQRYFQKSYNNNVVAGTITLIGRESLTASGSVLSTTVRFAPSMRASPTITVYSPNTGNTGIDTGTADDVGATVADISINSVRVAKGGTPQSISFHYTAESEL